MSVVRRVQCAARSDTPTAVGPRSGRPRPAAVQQRHGLSPTGQRDCPAVHQGNIEPLPWLAVRQSSCSAKNRMVEAQLAVHWEGAVLFVALPSPPGPHKKCCGHQSLQTPPASLWVCCWQASWCPRLGLGYLLPRMPATHRPRHTGCAPPIASTPHRRWPSSIQPLPTVGRSSEAVRRWRHNGLG